MRVCPRSPPCPNPAHAARVTRPSPSSRAAAPSRASIPARSPSSIAQGRVLSRRRRPAHADVHAQRAEAAAGAAVRRRRRRRALRLFGVAGRAAVREPFRRAAARRGGRRHAGARRLLGGRPAVRHARARLLRGARRGAAAAAVFAARAQLLGQAQRRCSRTACNAATPKADYLAFDHPLQQAIRRAVARFTGVAGERARRRHRRLLGAELRGAARALAPAFARLASAEVDADYGRAPRTLADAMIAHPEMVSGERRSDLALMQAGRGDWVTKIGAEGVQAIGVRSHGSASRSRSPTARSAACTRPSSPSSTRSACSTRPRGRRWRRGAKRTLRNYRGIDTGEIRPAVVLDNRQSAHSAVLPAHADAELGTRQMVCCCKRAPRAVHGRPVQGSRAVTPAAAPAVRRA